MELKWMHFEHWRRSYGSALRQHPPLLSPPPKCKYKATKVFMFCFRFFHMANVMGFSHGNRTAFNIMIFDTVQHRTWTLALCNTFKCNAIPLITKYSFNSRIISNIWRLHRQKWWSEARCWVAFHYLYFTHSSTNKTASPCSTSKQAKKENRAQHELWFASKSQWKRDRKRAIDITKCMFTCDFHG